MTPYRDVAGNSGVESYDVGMGYIDVEFKDGAAYRYTNASAGFGNVAEMVRLARAGVGLNSFINTNVRKSYSTKLR